MFFIVINRRPGYGFFVVSVAKIDIFLLTSKSFGNYFCISISKSPAAEATGLDGVTLRMGQGTMCNTKTSKVISRIDPMIQSLASRKAVPSGT